MQARETIKAAVEAKLAGLVERVTARAEEAMLRYPDREFSIDDMIRWELVAIGEDIDICKLHDLMAADEYGVGPLAACGRNREQGFLWARLEGATEHRLESGLIPIGQWLRRYDDPFNSLCGPDHKERPPAEDGSIFEVDSLGVDDEATPPVSDDMLIDQ